MKDDVMKPPPSKKKSTSTALKKPDINDRLSLDEATKLIASRTKDATDDDRAAEDRVRKRITRAASTGKLCIEKNGAFILGYLADWARTTWPDKFNDLPAYVCMSASGTIQSNCSAHATILAPTLEVCQERLNAANRRIEELEKEVAELRPGAAEWEKLRFKNSRNRLGKTKTQKI